MKKTLRLFLLNALSLYLTSQFFSGLIVRGGVESYAIGGVLLTIGEYIIKPILKIITLPLTIISFGLFSLFINAIVLLIVAKVYPNIMITSFRFAGITVLSFHIPAFDSNILLSYILISATIYVLTSLVNWLFS